MGAPKRTRLSSRLRISFKTYIGLFTAAATIYSIIGHAEAANECGIAAPSTAITCNGDGAPATDANPYAGGIRYSVPGITLNLSGTINPISIVRPGGSGVILVGNGAAPVFLNAQGIVNVTARDFGIGIGNTIGAATINYNNGTIRTGPRRFSVGIYTQTDGSGDSTINYNDGTIISSGPFSYSINAWSFGTGDAIINYNAGQIFGSGNYVGGPYARAAANGNALITYNSGSITSSGFRGYGVLTQSDGRGDATVLFKSGTVKTSGREAVGVHAYVGGGGKLLIDVGQSTDITTTGNLAYGILGTVAPAGNTKSLTIKNAGDATTSGSFAHGIWGWHGGSGGIVIENTGDLTVSGPDSDGIRAQAFGTGTYEVNLLAGTLISGTGAAAGIHTLGNTGGTVNIAASANLDGSASGVAILDEQGPLTLNTSGTLAGNVLANGGGDKINLLGGTITGAVSGGTGPSSDTIVLSGTVVTGLIYGDDIGSDKVTDGDDKFLWNSGSAAGFKGGAGSDAVTITASSFNGGQLLDGGDDTSIADGDIDTLMLTSWNGKLRGGKVLNFENVVIDGGSVSLTGGALTTGQDIDPTTFLPTSGLMATNGGSVDLGDGFALIGNLSTRAGTTVTASTTTGSGDYSVFGQFLNNGTLDFSGSSPAAGDRMRVIGDYFGGGAIEFDAALDASRRSDRLTISGSVRVPGTRVTVNDVGAGLGTPTGRGPRRGIKLIDVSNTGATRSGDFVLNGELRTGGISGAYVYNLFLESDDNWYLQNVYVPDPTSPGPRPGPRIIPLYAPTVPTHEVYPQVLLGLNTLPTLQQRVGNRHWRGRSGIPNPCSPYDAEIPRQWSGYSCDEHPILNEAPGGWARLTATRSHIDPAKSTTSATYDVDQFQFEVGADVYSNTASDGAHFVVGVALSHGWADADVSSPFGNGSLDVTGTGLGLTSTYYAPDGIYLDGQARATWLSSELAADAVGSFATDDDTLGYALGLEAGKRIQVSDKLSITPQAQLVYSRIDTDTFRDRFNGTISLRDSDSLLLRTGLSFDQERKWSASDGSVSRLKLYGLANLYYEFLDRTEVDVSGAKFNFQNDDLWGELGLGGTYSWNDELYSVFGEVAHKASLADFHESYSTSGKVGFRIKF